MSAVIYKNYKECNSYIHYPDMSKFQLTPILFYQRVMFKNTLVFHSPKHKKNGLEQVIHLYLKISENFVHLILQNEFQFMHIPFGSLAKFHFLAQFSMNHLLLPVMSSLVLFLDQFAAFTYVINNFIFWS